MRHLCQRCQVNYHAEEESLCVGCEAEVEARYERKPDPVNNPPHYGGVDNPYEAIKVIEAWGLGFCVGNCLKYLCRAGKKDGNDVLQDLKKASWYLRREIERREKEG